MRMEPEGKAETQEEVERVMKPSRAIEMNMRQRRKIKRWMKAGLL